MSGQSPDLGTLLAIGNALEARDAAPSRPRHGFAEALPRPSHSEIARSLRAICADLSAALALEHEWQRDLNVCAIGKRIAVLAGQIEGSRSCARL